MDLRAFAVCRGFFEVYPSSRFCPHCATDGNALPPPAPQAPAAPTVDDLAADDPVRPSSVWLAGLAVAGLALALIVAASSV